MRIPFIATCLMLMFQADAWSQRTPYASSRRAFLVSTAASTILGSASLHVPAANAASSNLLIDELKDSKSKLIEVPDLLERQEWDKSQNTLTKLAKESGNVDLFELKDELATTIQMCDQLTYDNVFIYYQPGNGKINIKEPVSLAKQAIQQLQTAIETASE
ncbi:hypothetical protein MPSEU_000146800 [Mayamaea pseudoterrestris]|nr:hypothetical protein MPSEU_000146800 [Mayamaea pseudoterrestris]